VFIPLFTDAGSAPAECQPLNELAKFMNVKFVKVIQHRETGLSGERLLNCAAYVGIIQVSHVSAYMQGPRILIRPCLSSKSGGKWEPRSFELFRVKGPIAGCDQQDQILRSS
jgi:hypothetical protein